MNLTCQVSFSAHYLEPELLRRSHTSIIGVVYVGARHAVVIARLTSQVQAPFYTRRGRVLIKVAVAHRHRAPNLSVCVNEWLTTR